MSEEESGSTDFHAADILQLVSFKIGSEEFAINILEIQEIIRTVEVTTVPRAPHFVEGVINLRGKVIPIIDLRKRFGLPSIEKTKNTRIVVVDFDNKVVGLVVDYVSEVLRLPASTIEPPPPMLAGIDSDYISGVGKLDDRLLIMLAIARVLSQDESSELDF